MVILIILAQTLSFAGIFADDYDAP